MPGLGLAALTALIIPIAPDAPVARCAHCRTGKPMNLGFGGQETDTHTMGGATKHNKAAKRETRNKYTRARAIANNRAQRGVRRSDSSSVGQSNKTKHVQRQ